ncbi:hypothetical protein ACIPW5_01835 [Streptomyces sp. NPDC090077]|uniref:hypothetical protein n=1 Tax=Streptomyces sp. NPDC090077 TaxID=3365938 RepID=UPI00380B3367
MKSGEAMGYIERPRRIVEGPARDPRATGGRPGPAPAAAGAGRPPGPVADRLKDRSRELLEAVSGFDAGLDEAARRRLADWIRAHYESEHPGAPVGFLARCHLGPPYVDHVLDLFGAIVTHYAPRDTLPEPYGGARMLVRNPGYAYVEVHSDGLVLPVLAGGSVVRPAGPRSGGAA